MSASGRGSKEERMRKSPRRLCRPFLRRFYVGFEVVNNSKLAVGRG